MGRITEITEANEEELTPEELEAVLVEEEGGCRFEERCKVSVNYICGWIPMGTVENCPKRKRWLDTVT